MEHPHIDDQHVVDRYLAGELPDEEAERFEEHLFECEACLEAAEWGEELRRGVRSESAHPAGKSQRKSMPAMPYWPSSMPGRTAFAGLTILFLALGSLLVYQRAELKRLRDAPDVGSRFTVPTADFQVASLGVVRSGEVAEIRLDPGRSALLLSLELSEVAAASYRVTLYDDSDRVVWQGEDLEPSLFDTLMVAVPSSFLTTGTYRATIESLASSPGTEVDTIEFAVLSD